MTDQLMSDSQLMSDPTTSTLRSCQLACHAGLRSHTPRFIARPSSACIAAGSALFSSIRF